MKTLTKLTSLVALSAGLIAAPIASAHHTDAHTAKIQRAQKHVQKQLKAKKSVEKIAPKKVEKVEKDLPQQTNH